ncbi:MAG: hypothetical protein ABI741_08025 [Ferruginibacter sp.]
MLKGLISILFLLISQWGFAQKKTFTESEQSTLDSLLKDDEFFNMLKKSMKPKSYLQLTVTLGNSYFSIKNKRLEASQLESKLVFTPDITYYHKSGLGISADAFLTSFDGKSDFYQFSLTPSYTVMKSKKIAATVSYTRFFRRDGYEDAATPIQNDLFATIYLKKPWLEPGISLGFSGGRNTEYKRIDTVFFGTQRIFTDTIKSTIHAFSVSAYIQHSFEYLNLLNKKDGISIVPKLIVNAGVNKYSEKHYNPYSAFFKRLLERRNRLGKLQDDTSFEFQSVACNLDINYIIGKFGFEPQAYLDYYLPETTDKKFTFVFSFGVNYAF